MARLTGDSRTTVVGEKRVSAFLPRPLPPRDPPLRIRGVLAALHVDATAALGRLVVAGDMVPSTNWLLYGFVRKEAVVTSQIEGTEATLMDVVTYEATRKSERPADVEEVSNYVEALSFARSEIARRGGLPLSVRLLCAAHQRLIRGVRGADRLPGTVRTSQNWIGGPRPGKARFVPPPPEAVPGLLSDLERWLHAKDKLPPLVRIGLAHVQFETIHPFLDGNGRIGRLLVALLLEHWGLLRSPLLYVSLAFKRRRAEYYQRLSAVRTRGDWEGWTKFFLRCVRESADDGVNTAKRLFRLVGKDRQALTRQRGATIHALRLFDLLPEHPVVTLPRCVALLQTTKPTATKAIEALRRVHVLDEITGRRRNRVYTYAGYLKILSDESAPPA